MDFFFINWVDDRTSKILIFWLEHWIILSVYWNPVNNCDTKKSYRKPANIFLGIGGLFTRNKQFRCPNRRLLFPCVWSETIDAQGQCFLAITCPQGGSLQEIQDAFNRIPVRTNIDTIVLNLPAGANAIPANFLGNNRAKILQLIGPAGSVQQNILTVIV